MRIKKLLAAASASLIAVSAMAVAAFAADTDHSIQNGDFETGDLSGWTYEEGTADGQILGNAVIDAETFWAEQVPYNRGGSYHFDGWAAKEGVEFGEDHSYSLKSTTFTLGGSGFISFKMGGNAAVVKVFLEDGRQIAEFSNTEFKDVEFPHIEQGGRWATMTTFVADLHEYVDNKLYIELHDVGNPNGWGVAFFDDIVTYYETAPVVADSYDDVTIYCENEAGETYQMPWVAAENTVTNPPAPPVTPGSNDDVESGDQSAAPILAAAAIAAAGVAIAVGKKRTSAECK